MLNYGKPNIDGMYSKAKIFGHALHPILIAFPVTFYTTCFLCFAAYSFNGNPVWFRYGVISNVAGVITALVAAIPGFIDWAFGIPREHPGKKTGLVHMVLNLVALAFFAANAYVQFPKRGDVLPDAGPAVILTLAGLLVTGIAGTLGWMLVARHHVGVELSEEQKKDEAKYVSGGMPRPH